MSVEHAEHYMFFTLLDLPVLLASGWGVPSYMIKRFPRWSIEKAFLVTAFGWFPYLAVRGVLMWYWFGRG